MGPGISDRSPISIEICENVFKLRKFWMKHRDFQSILLESWTSVSHGNPVISLSYRLKDLKNGLEESNKRFFSNISGRVVQKKDRVGASAAYDAV